MPCRRLLLGSSCRAALLAVVLASLAGPWTARAAEELLAPQPLTAAAGQFEPVEFRLNVPGDYARPFDPDEVAVDLAITGPDGARVVQPAFFGQPYERQRLTEGGRTRDWFYPNGPARWQARFAPTAPGTYQAKLVVRDRRGTRESAAASFSCTASTRRGYVRVSTRDPRFLELSTGQAFFPLGQNLAFIGSGQYMTLAKAEEAFAKLADNGANYLRVWTCCGDWAMAIEAEKNAFARSWAGPAAFVPDPAEPNSGRRGVTFPKGKNTLDVEPSHPVGLRPETTYTLTARWYLEPGTSVRLEARGVRATNALSAGATAAWVPFSHTFRTGPGDRWLGSVRFHHEGFGTAVLADLSLREAAGGPELLWEADLNRPARGYYNPLDAFMLDELVAAASRHGLYLQLCLLTRDLYMKDLKDPTSEAYTRAIADAKKFLRYAVARWGYATSVAAWEYWNEQDPGLPTDRFYTELGDYLRNTDPNHHLRTTSTWGPSPKDCRHPQLDLADTHFYLRPTDRNRLADEVEAVLERARWLREQAPAKPACLGEFGIADDKWGLRDEMKRSPELADAHNALWASALSGLSATAWCWWWERLDERDVYPHYRPLSRFIADVPWTSGSVQPAHPHVSDDRLHAVGLRAGDRAWLWLCNRQATWPRLVLDKVTPTEISGVTVELDGFPSGTYRFDWRDARNGHLLRTTLAGLTNGPLQSTPSTLRLSPPPFAHDIVVKVTRIWNPDQVQAAPAESTEPPEAGVAGRYDRYVRNLQDTVGWNAKALPVLADRTWGGGYLEARAFVAIAEEAGTNAIPILNQLVTHTNLWARQWAEFALYRLERRAPRQTLDLMARALCKPAERIDWREMTKLFQRAGADVRIGPIMAQYINEYGGTIHVSRKRMLVAAMDAASALVPLGERVPANECPPQSLWEEAYLALAECLRARNATGTERVVLAFERVFDSNEADWDIIYHLKDFSWSSMQETKLLAPILGAALHSGDEGLRRHALETLRELGPRAAPTATDVVAALRREVTAPGFDPEDASDALGLPLSVLRQLGPIAAPAVPVLVRLVEETAGTPFDGYIGSVLAAIGTNAAIVAPRFLRRAEQTQGEERLDALQIVAAVAPSTPQLVPLLLPVLEATNYHYRTAAAGILGVLQPPATNALPALWKRIEREEYFDPWLAAAEAIIRIDPAGGPTLVPHLIQVLVPAADEPWVATAAPRLLREISPPPLAALPELMKLRTHSSASVRVAAELTIAKLDPARKAECAAAVEAILTNGPPARQQFPAGKALWQLEPGRGPRIAETLGPLVLPDHDFHDQRDVARFLGEMGPAARAATTFLREGLSVFDWSLRRACRDALELIERAPDRRSAPGNP